VTRVRAALATDGSSDHLLVHILRWIWEQHTEVNIRIDTLDQAFAPPTHRVEDRIGELMRQYPDSDLIFIHRDAEENSSTIYDQRTDEIEEALNIVRGSKSLPPHVCVIPIRMTEAWLLFDEDAIRAAAGNPNGRMSLNLPALNEIEHRNAKQELFVALKIASGLSGGRLNRFQPQRHRHLVAEYIDDYSPLKQLSAFQQLEADIIAFIKEWDGHKS